MSDVKLANDITLLPIQDGIGKWTALEIYQQYKVREQLIKQMVGTLSRASYPSILQAEMDVISDEAVKRFETHPNWFPEKKLLGKWITKDL